MLRRRLSQWWFLRRKTRDVRPIKSAAIWWLVRVAGLKFPTHTEPEVSVLISMYGQPRLTLEALLALWGVDQEAKIEVLLADDQSPDGSGRFFKCVPGLRLFQNALNLGYLRTNNFLATQARGKYLLLLNNDTRIQPGALRALLRVFQEHPDAGMVGAKLLNLDGTLQEAGSQVQASGAASKRGWGQDECRPEYNRPEPVDYCSAAGVLISRALFQEVGGFDELYLPSHYEDVDLAFKVRAASKVVYYQPQARIIHREGATCSSQGPLNHTSANQPKFQQKWAAVLDAGDYPSRRVT